jgi:cellobiose phosphorylase
MGIRRSSGSHGGVYPIRHSQIPEDDRRLLLAAASIIFDGQIGSSLAQHLARPPAKATVKTEKQALPLCSLEECAKKVSPSSEPHLSEDGREYVMSICHTSPTPLPWVNVIANPGFGTVISERGASYTWFENAHEFRLTPWFNDPVTDPSGESFYIQDLDSKRFWSPMPWPTEGEGDYNVRHGFGYSVFEHRSDDIASETWVYVDADEPVKYVLIRLHNKSARARRLAVTGLCEWVLGSTRTKTAMHIVTSSEDGIILARNPYLINGPERTAFFSARGSTSLSGDRREILGDLGSRRTPVAMLRGSLSGRTGPALDPCAGLRVPIELAANASQEVVFILGAGQNYQQAIDLAKTVTHKRPPAKVLRAVRQAWQERLSVIAIETPDRSINSLANGWLLYQTISSRLWGRSGFFQSGGAYGFRDQLQDVVALVHAEPMMARAHILRATARQFPEGDVQHWWHPPSGRGVRTGFSDDYLWLPWAVAHYVSATKDYSVLDELVPFVEGRPLKLGEESYYDLPNVTEGRATLYQHCTLAINRASRRLGVHGLPLMGAGDWNDGMNLVGAQGQGESVWLAFFLYDVLERFGRIAAERHDETTGQLCTSLKAQLSQDIDLHTWDGKWYLRAFFDSGDPLGSEQNTECQIDLLPQAWAVLSGAAKPERASMAMHSVDERLVRRADQLIQLFDPPFSRAPLNPGYVKGYPPGVRENGGQYTHAAVWAIWAFAALGKTQTAWELLDLINPMRRGWNKKDVLRYMVEPYVVAADVYSQPPHTGRGGWTWYTGSAAWMYRLIIEGLLGIRRAGDRLLFNPSLNKEWDSCEVRYRFKATTYHLTLKQGPIGTGCRQIHLDGALVDGDGIELADDGIAHQVVIQTN